ncbi:glycosyltransferase [Desulfocicer niacini]
MKILFSHYAIIDKEGFGRSFMLARGLAALGNDVTFITSLPAKKFIFPYYDEVREKVKIIAFPDIVPDFMRRTGFGLLSVILKTFYVLVNNFEIYHSDAGHRPSGGFPIIFKKIFVPLIYITEWWDYFGRGGQFDNKKGIKKITHGYYDLIFEVPEKKIADGVICLSTGMFNRAKKLNSNNNIVIISGGSDIESIPFYPTVAFRKKYNISTSSLTFGFVGMNREEVYDIMPFIKAIQDLIKSGLDVTWYTTGGYIPETIKKELNIGKELIEFGWVDYKYFSEILSCADCFILLQREDLKSYTRWPNKIGDYLAAGRPILTNPFGEMKRIVADNEHCFFTTQYNVESTTQIIKDIYINRPDQNLRCQIRGHAENEVSWNKKAQQLLSFYEKVKKINK